MKQILVVDDELINRELLEAMLGTLGYEARLAASGAEALVLLGPDIDLVLLDAMMPNMTGFEVARKIRSLSIVGDIPIIMVTALNTKEDRLCAVEAGANDFITKPVDKTELRIRMNSLLKMKEAQDAIKRHRAMLEETVRLRTMELQHALQDMSEARKRTYEAHLDTIYRLALAAEYRDTDTAAHIRRVAEYSALIARAMGLPREVVEQIRIASPMHDVGKIGVPDVILLKPGRLTPDEFALMQQHTIIGRDILHNSSSELLQMGEVIAFSHHEKWDGSGYPTGLLGEAIPLYGRICAIADVFDALTSKRPYKPALPDHEALTIMKDGRGTHFDPHLLDLFFQHLDRVLQIRKMHGEEDMSQEVHGEALAFKSMD